MALENIKIYKYNNYFNRIVKRSSILSDYGTPIYSLNSTNFNPSDGIDTQHIIGTGDYDGEGDYLLVLDAQNNISTRWFIMDGDRTKNGQYILTLRRDLVADFYDKIVNTPLLVERAMISSEDNPLLYNPEGFSFNQIKKQEILLKDKIQKAWYVLYFKKGMPAQTGTYIPTDANYDEKINTTIAASIYNSGTYKYTENEDINVTYRSDTTDFSWLYPTNQYVMHNRQSSISINFDSISTLTSVIWFNNDSNQCKYQLEYAFSGQFSNLKADMLTDTGNSSQVTTDVYNKLRASNGKIVLTSDNKLYQISVTDSITTPSGKLTGGSTVDRCKALINTTTLDKSDHFGANTVGYSMTLHTLTVAAEEITSGTYTWNIDFSECPCEDSDFDIIAIPYQDCRFYNGNLTFNVKGSVNERFVRSIMSTIPHADSGGYLVDVQLLPYCPDPNVFASGTNSYIDVSSYTDQSDLTKHPRYSYNNAGNINNNSFMLYVVKSNVTFDITKSLTVPSFTGNTAIDYKVSNECELYKIVSPNYNGSFEFSVAKNHGVANFNVDITLKPYNPYIHINPQFKGLYGSDWNDSRGLICGGDFSLPVYTSAWETYELQNKNYQNIFDRQVRNLDFMQKQQTIAETASSITGVVRGGSSGAMAGGVAGGAWGAVAGAVIGTGGAVAGGAIDANLLAQTQAENRSMLIDNYKYQLGNIKALPDTVNKVSPLNFNNKIWPFLEVYSSTDDEKNLFVNYLTYRSMSINAIGSISAYMQSGVTFIKGQILRLEDLGVSCHEASEIYNEIFKGIYI